MTASLLLVPLLLQAVPDWLQQAVDCKPSPRQLAWQQLEFTAFCHFGVNTFSGREWGTGTEDEKTFNPVDCDPEQWVLAAKSAGMKLVNLTAKHHDGFCLWPSRFTRHCVKQSPWRDGHGDVVKLLSQACAKHGLKLGLYCSPADLNAIAIGVYGNKSAKQHRVIPTAVDGWTPARPERFEGDFDDYNTYFMNQLFELLTEYGEIGEVWFDGANPKPGTGQTYDYAAWFNLIRTLQPNAVIFGGPDVRWIGNESGGSRAAEWSPVVVPRADAHGDMTGADLGSRERLKHAAFLRWYPAETDVPIRHGWFYRDEQQGSRSVDELLDIWYRAVGGNSVLLLNMSPNRRGLIPAGDVQRLARLGELLRATFAADLAAGATASASASRPGHAPALAVDTDAASYWAPPDETEVADLTLTLPEPRTFNRIVLQEAIGDCGQRIERHAVDAWVDGAWREVGSGQTVGYKKILRCADTTTDKVRVRILGSRVCPTLSRVGLFREPLRLAAPNITRGRDGALSFTGVPAGTQLVYTLDGSEPTAASPVYAAPVPLPKGGLVRARLVQGTNLGPVAERRLGVAKSKWTVVDCNSAEPDCPAQAAIDDNPATVWHTEWKTRKPKHPHWVAVSLGEPVTITAFTYLPRTGGGPYVEKYAWYVSQDGHDWGQPVATGAFGNIVNNPVEQTVPLAQPIKAAWFKFVALSQPNGHEEASAAELGVLGE